MLSIQPTKHRINTLIPSFLEDGQVFFTDITVQGIHTIVIIEFARSGSAEAKKFATLWLNTRTLSADDVSDDLDFLGAIIEANRRAKAHPSASRTFPSFQSHIGQEG